MFLRFFPWGWFLVSSHCDLRRCLMWFQFSWNCWGLFCILPCGLSLKKIHVHLKIMFILLLWGEMLCKYQSIKSIWSRMSFNATISLLIFCLDNMSIVESEVLKSPTMTILLFSSFLKSSKIFFILTCSYVECIYVYRGYILLLDNSLQYYVVTFFVSCYGLCFILFFKKDFIYLFSDRREGKEKERERNISVWLPLAHTPHPTGNLACNPGMCHD